MFSTNIIKVIERTSSSAINQLEGKGEIPLIIRLFRLFNIIVYFIGARGSAVG
jgi:hypothetical protein